MVQLSDTRADLGTSSLNRSVTEAPFMHTVRAMPTLAAALVGPLIVTGCSSASRSYPALAKIAHAVPVPSGLTYVNEIDHNNAAMFPGSDKNEVDLVYSNTSLAASSSPRVAGGAAEGAPGSSMWARSPDQVRCISTQAVPSSPSTPAVSPLMPAAPSCGHRTVRSANLEIAPQPRRSDTAPPRPLPRSEVLTAPGPRCDDATATNRRPTATETYSHRSARSACVLPSKLNGPDSALEGVWWRS